MISADDALAIVLENAAPLAAERVPLLAALGRAIAEEIRAPRDLPGFDNSAMDGYAVRAADVARAAETNPVKLDVVETVPAGKMPVHRVGPGQAARTMTGAPIAEGADAIVPVEKTRGGDDTVEILSSAAPGDCIRPRGEDLKAGETAIAAGTRLSPAGLGMLAALNRAMVEVFRRPRVAIVTTGDELVDIDQAPTGAQIVNSNAYALAGAIREAGGDPAILKIARDDPAEIRARLAEALAFDAVLSTGGVSVGNFDYVKGALDELGVRNLFHGVAQRPGRPLKFGMLGGRPVFGLPGNPVSTLVCFYLYARPAILKMGGFQRLGLPRVRARCGTEIKLAKGLTEFVRVQLEPEAGEWIARPAGSQGSGVFSSLTRAGGLLIGPAAETMLAAGAYAEVLLLDAESGPVGASPFEERRQSH